MTVRWPWLPGAVPVNGARSVRTCSRFRRRGPCGVRIRAHGVENPEAADRAGRSWWLCSPDTGTLPLDDSHLSSRPSESVSWTVVAKTITPPVRQSYDGPSWPSVTVAELSSPTMQCRDVACQTVPGPPARPISFSAIRSPLNRTCSAKIRLAVADDQTQAGLGTVRAMPGRSL